MASITPRASGFWSDSGRTSYFPTDDDTGSEGDVDVEDLEQQHMIDEEDYGTMMEHDGRTPLDKTIDRIGMGMMVVVYFMRGL